MRCKSCDTLLSDREARQKDPQGRYLDLCGECTTVSTRAVWETLDEALTAKVVQKTKPEGT